MKSTEEGGNMYSLKLSKNKLPKYTQVKFGRMSCFTTEIRNSLKGCFLREKTIDNIDRKDQKN